VYIKYNEVTISPEKLYYGEYITRVPNRGIYQYCTFNDWT